ncbi:MAG: ACT domain-containing protein [Oscillospiraceae bacterium]
MAKSFLLVDSGVLPEVFLKVVKAKRLIASGEVKGLSGAAKAVDISRSALYKYKDKVFDISETVSDIATITVTLKDIMGALQSLLKLIAGYNVSVITITQSAPSDGTAAVSLDLKISDMTGNIESLIKDINSQNFVISAKEIIK